MRLPLDKTNTLLSIITYIIGIIGSLSIASTFLLHAFYPNKKEHEFVKFLIIGGVLLVILALVIAFIKYIISLKNKLKLSSIVIEGIQISSLNVANTLRGYNKDYKLHTASHDIIIDGTSLIQDYTCSGIKHKNIHNNNSFDFTVDADTNLSLQDLDCYAFDLKHDPNQVRKIYPILKSVDGQSKKIQVGFLEEIKLKSDFKLSLHTNIPDCMKKGKDYYLSSLSFDGSEKVDLLQLKFVFKNQLPSNIRVYEVLENGDVKQIKTLTADVLQGNEAVFNDKYNEIGSVKYLVYIFDRAF